MARPRKRTFYRINHYIQAEKVRVVDETGKQLGVMGRSQALLQAQSRGLDLVEVAPRANPPVCKIIDFKKFKYLQAKKKTVKKSKRRETKEIRLRPFIAKNDLQLRLKKARKFLGEKSQVRVTVVFKGRQIAKKEFGHKLIKSFAQALKDCAKVHQEPKLMGRRLIMILMPDEKSKQKNQDQDQKVNQKKVSNHENG